MTLVAIVTAGDLPVLTGDFLITTEGIEAPDRTIVLPTKGEISASIISTSERTITRLDQKLCLVNDYISFGWSGTRFYARNLYGLMREEFSENPATTDQIFSLLDRNPEIAENLQLVGLVTDGSEQISRFQYNARDIDTGLGSVKIAGSGEEHFLKVLNSVGKRNVIGDTTKSEESVAMLLSVTGMAMVEELETNITIENFYGGGFEFLIPTLEDGKVKLTKFDEYVHLHWVAVIHESGDLELSLLPLIIKPFYIGDVLCIARIANLGHAETPADGPKHQNYISSISPCYQKIDDSLLGGIGLPSIESFFYVNFVHVTFPDGTSKRAVFVKKKPSGIQFSNDGIEKSFEITDEYFSDIRDLLLS